MINIDTGGSTAQARFKYQNNYATLKLIEFYQDPISEYEGILTETLDDIIIKTKNCNYIAVQVKTKKNTR